MLVRFPNLDTLRLALTSGAVPENIRSSPTQFAIADDQSLWVQTAESLGDPVRKDLRKLGIRFPKTANIQITQTAGHWLQMLPVTRSPNAEHVDAKTPILFELSDEGQLAEVATEILRLGNDRQSFRWIESNGQAKALLRVVGPPYYSLLRAIDRAGQPGAPLAFREAAPRVWIQLGYDHPLAEHFRPPTGQWVFLRPPHEWTYLPEAKLRDIYDVLDFALPDQPTNWHAVEPAEHIRVPVRLTRSGSADDAELWVLQEAGLDELEAFVAAADNALLARLAFAVGAKDGGRVVVVRVRPSKAPPPVLVLDGLAFRSYLRIPNLFLPVGTALHPPLRRDAVTRLFAEDKTRITWLRPGDNGTFTPESLPDSAFRPLSDWVDYVLEHEQEPIAAWLGATQFQFEGFICKDDVAKEKKPKEPTALRTPKEHEIPKPQEPAPLDIKPGKPPKRTHDFTPDVVDATPSELEARLRELEEAFAALQTPLEDPDRQTLWRDMARLNGVLHHHGDSAICWGNALWEQEVARAEDVRGWNSAEAKDATSAAGVARLLKKDTPTHANLRVVTAYVIWAAQEATPAAELRPHLGKLQQFLERHEAFLGVRQAWLAWNAVYQISGDVLALVRARDRLLERLYLNGLTPDLDLPSFLRFGGQQASHRFRQVREQVVGLRRLVQDWSKVGPNPTAATHTYIDLIFAFGLARLGETGEGRKLLHDARAALASADEVHRWLVDAFTFRIEQALEGKPSLERLPETLLERLEAIEHPAYLQHADPYHLDTLKQGLRITRLKIERLRTKSRILEPVERLYAYRHWVVRADDELQRELTALTDVSDRAELHQRFDNLFTGKHKIKHVTKTDSRILVAALELAPRLGQAFAESVLDRVPAAMAKLKDAERTAELLEKSLFLAAHCDRREDVQSFIGQFHELLGNARSLPHEKLIPLVTGSFRSLRKFGLRDTAAQLLERLADVVGADQTAPRGASAAVASVAVGKRVCLLLELAGAWFFFDAEAKARKVLDEARQVLATNELYYVQQTEVACAYLSALGQAPLEFALARIIEFFRTIEGVYDNYTTTSHYSLTRLNVVEAMMLAIVSDDFTLDREARKRLDDDEFLVRRRIHRDVREALAKAGM